MGAPEIEAILPFLPLPSGGFLSLSLSPLPADLVGHITQRGLGKGGAGEARGGGREIAGPGA